MDEDDYKVHYRAKSPTTTNPAVYDKNVPNNAMNVVRFKAEVVHAAKITDYELFAAAERETRNFILAVVEDTWVRKLREPVMLYTAISPYEILAHLQALCGGLHALNVLALQNYIQNYH